MLIAVRGIVDGKTIVDSSGQPIKEEHLGDGIRAAVKGPGLDGWTFAVLALQAVTVIVQTGLFRRQTTLMDDQAKIAETQQRLPNQKIDF
jgi:hypothetical protein